MADIDDSSAAPAAATAPPVQAETGDDAAPRPSPRRRPRLPTKRTTPHHGVTKLAIGALGIVYGDIGTSPLYAFRESLGEHYGIAVIRLNVLGVLSLILWSLIIVVSIKYLVFVMKADHEGEGGVLVLTSLVPRSGDYHGKGLRRLLLLVGVFGTALLYGDGMITPAISVLSAVEGISVVTDAFDPLIIPLSCVILIALFAFQPRGTAAVGAVFGPIMIAWFVVLAVLGIGGIARAPEVLEAVNPVHAVQFFLANGFTGVLVLGSVVLVVTGGEALYADMGHFGVLPVRLAWFGLVLPGLVLNYFGQGGLLLTNPQAVDNPFFRLAPEWATIPLVVLSTMATVIASQALISGAFSLSVQAVQMGYLPRLRVRHTSDAHIGQVYIPGVNWTLMLACLGLVLGFRTSGNLAATYGIALTMTMVVTTLLFFAVARERFGWSRNKALAICGAFLIVDLGFLTGNIFKIPNGGWFPLVVGLLVFTGMTTWRRGRALVARRVRTGKVPLEAFIADLGDEPRVPGTAFHLSANPGAVPMTLLVNLRHNNALHERIVLLHVNISSVAHVPSAKRATIKVHDKGFAEVTLRYGFRDPVDVPRAIRERVGQRHKVDEQDFTYVVGHEHILATNRPGMSLWRERLFALMNRNASNITQAFNLPADRVIHIGRTVDI